VVPRHLFVPPGTSLAVAYDADTSPISKTVDGVSLSSVSAPWVQALMIGQAGIRPGMRVLEIGSGGYNAALLAEIVVRSGLVVTIDIDPDVTSRASTVLDAAGYGNRVIVATADGELGSPQRAPFDAVITTVGAWDIPPAWTSQLATGHSRCRCG
jgi:protein-L-isoaspartate(D-aspartate) O-methyltransferase